MKIIFRKKGGEGSGHFDHAGIPGHHGGSLPGDTKVSPLIMYRGIGAKTVGKVLSDGITRVKDPFGRPPSVYFMKSRSEIHDYVVELFSDKDSGFAILEFEIPQEFRDSVLDVEEEGDAYRLEADIPAEYIRNVWHYDSNGDLTRSQVISKLKSTSEFRFGYISMSDDSSAKKELLAILKGGEGSGHYGHSGIPDHVGGSLPGAGSVPESYRIRARSFLTGSTIEGTVALVKGGSKLPDAFTDKWLNVEDETIIPVAYDSHNNVWHVAGDEGMEHRMFSEKLMQNSTDDEVIFGVLDLHEDVLQIYELTISDDESNVIVRTQKLAEKNSFYYNVDGEPVHPKVIIASEF